MDKVALKDRIFVQFCLLLDRIRHMKHLLNQSVRIRGVEKRFEIWLKTQAEIIGRGETEELLSRFRKFEEEILADCVSFLFSFLLSMLFFSLFCYSEITYA